MKDSRFETFLSFLAISLVTAILAKFLGVFEVVALTAASLLLALILDRKTNCNICGGELVRGKCVKNEYCIYHFKPKLA